MIPVATASAEPSEPRARLDLFAEAGVYTAQSGVGFGLAGAVEQGLLAFGLSATAGGRAPTFQVTPLTERAAVGFATAELDLRLGGGPAGSQPIGLTALVDTALLDPVERDCSRRFGCRNALFLAASPDAAAGLSLQPAAGVRFLSGPATSGVRTATLVGLQPTQWYGDLLLVPRVDLRVWSVERPWSLHAWANRYGAAVGFGHRLAGGG